MAMWQDAFSLWIACLNKCTWSLRDLSGLMSNEQSKIVHNFCSYCLAFDRFQILLRLMVKSANRVKTILSQHGKTILLVKPAWLIVTCTINELWFMTRQSGQFCVPAWLIFSVHVTYVFLTYVAMCSYEITGVSLLLCLGKLLYLWCHV